MRILSMTATFGKLDGATLTLEPGLNVIEAPNEWGKSTWCAFLLAMLYGVDTRQRTKTGMLADKDHYKPWSGKPMEGTLRILWQDRDITIQRTTRGRIPLGEFRAFETASGVAVGELTAENCGQVLLGAERSVYSRSGFITGRSLEVTEDPELRRRLNLLVTTGQDSPETLRLETRLRELNRACQYRGGGAIPQTRQALEQCRQRQESRRALSQQAQTLRNALKDNQTRQKALLEHLAALDAQKSREDRARIEEARQAEIQAGEQETRCREQCRDLPDPAETERRLRELENLEKERRTLELEYAMTPTEPEPPAPAVFQNLTTEQAMEQARQETERLQTLRQHTETARGRFLWIPGLLLALAGAGAALLPALRNHWLLPAAGGLVLLVLWLVRKAEGKKNRRALEDYSQELAQRYGHQEPLQAAEEFARLRQGYETRKTRRETLFAARRQALEQRRQSIGYDRQQLLEARQAHRALADACRDHIRATHHREQLEAVAGELSAGTPAATTLTLTRQEAAQELERLRGEYPPLRGRLEVCAAQAQALPGEQALRQEQQALEERLQTLERWQQATALSLELLKQAQTQLSRRFAPRISREAGEILGVLTEDRYNRLLLEEDFTLLSQSPQETVTREVLWRSTGTEDQMYLALRLAVARVLLPEAPLVLDDAMARFDRQRENAALEYLRGMGRQVLVFRCK